MHLSEVIEVLADLREADCRAWVAGGWGVDALVGGQTRPHRDLDLAIDGATKYQLQSWRSNGAGTG